MSIFGDKDDDVEFFPDSNESRKESRNPPVRAPRPPVSNQRAPRPPVASRPEPRTAPQNSGRANTGIPRERPAPVAPSRGLPPKPVVPTRNAPRATPQAHIPAYADPVEDPQIMYATEAETQYAEEETFSDEYVEDATYTDYEEQPAPIYREPEYTQPAPIYREPEQYVQPAPVYREPEPEYNQQAPVYREQEYAQPSPTYREPEPAYVEPTPVYRETMRNMEPAESNSRRRDPENGGYSDDHNMNTSSNERSFNSRSTRQVREVEEIDEDDFDEVIVNNRRGSSAKNSNSRNAKKNTANSKTRTTSKKKSSKKNDDSEKPVSRFFGGRRRVIINNISVATICLLIVGFGVKSVVAPPYIPSQSDVEAVVSGKLNITGFDKDGGRPFVSAFAKEYFSAEPESASSSKDDRLRKFTTDEIASTISSSTTAADGAKQAITGEPQIAKISAIDDANAIYNVGVKLGNRWVYIDIPVFYDVRTFSYAISGVPTFTPPTTVAQPGETGIDPISQDIEVQELTEANIVSFFKAWAASDSEGLSRYVTGDSDAETRLGLQNSVYFGSLASYSVEIKDLEDPTAKERRAIAQVEWNNAAKNPTMKYVQTFELKLFKQPDDRWYVADITSMKEPYKPIEQSILNEPVKPTT